MTDTLFYKPKSAWERYAKDAQKVQSFAERYVAFLTECKTERETVRYVERRLREAGFGRDETTMLVPFREKALFAARKGTEPLEKGLSLIAAHVDSPRLDLKQRPLVEQADVVLGRTHYYGGIRKYQWLSRPLALHGVVCRSDGTTIPVCVGEESSDAVVSIADLLPHLAQKQQEQVLKDAFEGEKLKVLLGHRKPEKADAETTTDNKADEEPLKRALLAILHEKLGITEEDLITAELEVVPAGPARFVGLDRSMVGAYGQDDRICVFTALEALLEAPSSGRTKAVMFWDKEEIGSEGASGASSRFFKYCIEDCTRMWAPKAQVSHVLLETQALSADVTAAIDPDYQELHEMQNAAHLGYGPCFSKFTGSRGKYNASEADCEYFAQLRTLFKEQNIPWQAAELGKVDGGGGGTVALFMASWGMRVIDLGPALLAMHSPFEIASCVDVYSTWQAYSAFLAR